MKNYITKHNNTTPYHFLTAIVGINSPSLDCWGSPYMGTFSVKSRGIHQVMLEWAHIKDKMNTFQKSQD